MIPRSAICLAAGLGGLGMLARVGEDEKRLFSLFGLQQAGRHA